MNLESQGKYYKPKDELSLSVQTKSQNEKSLVALVAVDTALYNLRTNDKDPLNKVSMCIHIILSKAVLYNAHKNIYEGYMHASYE